MVKSDTTSAYTVVICALLSACLGVSIVFSRAQAETFGAPEASLGILSLSIDPLFDASCVRPDEHTLAAIVQVATDHGSHASGIVFDNNRVLTAAHAVQGAGHFFVRIEGVYRSADLVMVDHANDLAVLAVDTSRITPLVISGFHPGRSDPVLAAGYPKAQDMSMSMGVFKHLNNGVLYTSASIDSGQSGGGLLSCTQGRWSLVGMLRGYGAYLQGGEYVKLENHSVSVAGTTIHEFLRSFR